MRKPAKLMAIYAAFLAVGIGTGTVLLGLAQCAQAQVAPLPPQPQRSYILTLSKDETDQLFRLVLSQPISSGLTMLAAKLNDEIAAQNMQPLPAPPQPAPAPAVPPADKPKDAPAQAPQAGLPTQPQAKTE